MLCEEIEAGLYGVAEFLHRLGFVLVAGALGFGGLVIVLGLMSEARRDG